MTQPTPYGDGALLYFSRGWTDVFPVGSDAHPLAKSPVPGGPKTVSVTGYDAPPVGWERIKRGTQTRARFRNLGLRMPRQVIGIDVDDYEGHDGGATLARAEAALGPLPATYRNSARGDGNSGHRYFRTGMGRVVKPAAEALLTKAYGGGIEILHHGHRYAVAWPSLNPDKALAMYRWYGPDGLLLDGPPPRVIDLPVLSLAWQELLTALADSPAAARGAGGNLRASKEVPAAAADPDDVFENAAMTIRRSVAEMRTAEQLDAVLTMKAGAVNKTLGGAGIWFARMANAGLFTLEEARTLLAAAVARNGVHSDGWNIAHGRKWTAASRIGDALSQGLNREPFTMIDDHAPTTVFKQLMRKVAR
jgi:hypothetical protein